MIVEGRQGDFAPSGNKKLAATAGIPAKSIVGTKITNVQLNMQSTSIDAFLHCFPLRSPEHLGPIPVSNPSTTGAITMTERFSLVTFTLSQLLVQQPRRAPLASAFLLHAILLSRVHISARRLKEVELVDKSAMQDYRLFLNDFAYTSRGVIENNHWNRHMDDGGIFCDIVDLVDGSVFKAVLCTIQGRSNATDLLPEEIVQEFDFFAKIVGLHSGVHLHLSLDHSAHGEFLLPAPEESAIPSILRFSNTVLTNISRPSRLKSTFMILQILTGDR